MPLCTSLIWMWVYSRGFPNPVSWLHGWNTCTLGCLAVFLRLKGRTNLWLFSLALFCLHSVRVKFTPPSLRLETFKNYIWCIISYLISRQMSDSTILHRKVCRWDLYLARLLWQLLSRRRRSSAELLVPNRSQSPVRISLLIFAWLWRTIPFWTGQVKDIPATTIL